MFFWEEKCSGKKNSEVKNCLKGKNVFLFVLQECVSISVNFDGSFIGRTVFSHMKTQNDNTNHLAETYLEKKNRKETN